MAHAVAPRLGAEVSGLASPRPTTPSLYGLARLEELAPSSIGDVRDLAAVEKAVAAAAPERRWSFNREWEWGYRESDALGGLDPYSSSKAVSKARARLG